MADELVFYTNQTSRGRIVRWMLEEVGQPYRTELVGYGPPMKAPEFLRLNPMGKVPVLSHGDAVVTETAAICAYLADAFPSAGLAPPPGSPARAAYYRWLFFGAGSFEAAVVNAALGVEVPEGRQGMVGYGSLGRVLDTLDGALSGADHLAGGVFSAADVYVGSQVGYGMASNLIEKRPAFERYWARLARRPAAVRARATDDALAPPQGVA